MLLFLINSSARKMGAFLGPGVGLLGISGVDHRSIFRGHCNLAMEQLLGGAGGPRTGCGAHQFGRDLREIVSRGATWCCRY